MDDSSAKKMTAPSFGAKVLVLGAGYVSGPLIQYLSRNGCKLTVGSVVQAELDATSKLCPEVHTVCMNLNVPHDLEKMVSEHALVVCILPASFEPMVAKLCIKHKKNMVSASYILPEMRELHQQAIDAGITILKEMGVDPGIDHMLAMKCFDEVKQAGGKILSYVSYCGGIPAPECSSVPLKYKFSWFPKQVFANCLSGAKYKKDGQIIEVEGNGRLLDQTEAFNFLPGVDLESFPNRDSTLYQHQYNIESADTILRGTIRYKGFADSIKGLIVLGLLDSKPDNRLHPEGPDITWKEYIGAKCGDSSDISNEYLREFVFEKMDKDETKFQTVVDLGLLGDELIDKRGTPIDTLSNYLAKKKLSYGPGERDLVLMRHEVGIQTAGGKKEQRRIDFAYYGDPQGFSAMAQTVGITAGIGAKMLLDGEILTKGVIAPMSREIYEPILQQLKEEGIDATEVVCNDDE